MSCSRLMYIDKDGNPVFKPKRKYKTLLEASTIAKTINSQDKQIHKVEAYKCKECKSFHVGKGTKEIERPREVKREFRLFAKKSSDYITDNTVTNFGIILERSRSNPEEVIMQDLSTRKRADLFAVKFFIKEINPLGERFTDEYYEMYNGKLACYEVDTNQILPGTYNVYSEDGKVFTEGKKDKLIEKDDFTISLLDKITIK